jgi:predicted lysophospholipase L1 biosynthesis ABC-type transport system permease subunit
MMAGGLVIVMAAVVPTFRRLPDRLAVRLHREVDRYVDVPLPIFTIVTFATAVGLLALGSATATGTALLAVAVGGALVVALSSHFVNRPMNQRLRAWGDGSPPADYPALRRRWDAAHALRTVAGLTSLVCLIVAMLAR